MNDQPDEPVFDSLLEEMLTNQHPPDLTDVIQQRLRQELGPEQFEQLRQQRFRYSPNPTTVTPHTSIPTTAAARSAVARSADRSSDGNSVAARSINWSATLPLVAVLAASLVMALGLWELLPIGQPAGTSPTDARVAVQPQPTQPNQNDPLAQAPSQTQTSVPSPSNASVASQTSGQATPAPSVPIDLPLDKVPFTERRALPEFVENRPVIAPAETPMSDQEVVSWIDQRFATLWIAAEATVPPAVSSEELTQRLMQTLTNEASSSAEMSRQSPRELASKLVRTPSFAKHWSRQIVRQWLGSGASREASAERLQSFLTEQLQAARPWNEVLGALVGAAPQRSESALLATLAGGDNHRLASRIGSLLLDEALACARCHDASDNGRVISTDQDQYWSLLAMFNGLDAQVVDAQVVVAQGKPERVLIDRQGQLFSDDRSPSLFFDRPDGRLQAAQYRLPQGDNWRTIEGVQTPRESLARWISTTTVTDKASVNLAWRLVFGRPLVAQHSALDGAGLAERRAVLDKLAAQFQAHGRDMGQLVTWLVSSRPFASGHLELDRSRYFAANDVELEQWNRGLANFSLLPATRPEQVRSLEGALALVQQWSGNSQDRRTMLAQPTPTPLNQPAKTPAIAQPQSPLPPVGFLIRSSGPTSSQAVFIERLANSKLSWTQQVDHIAGLVGQQPGDAKLHSAAQKLLDSRSGDRPAALFQLLQSALLYQESW